MNFTISQTLKKKMKLLCLNVNKILKIKIIRNRKILTFYIRCEHQRKLTHKQHQSSDAKTLEPHQTWVFFGWIVHVMDGMVPEDDAMADQHDCRHGKLKTPWTGKCRGQGIRWRLSGCSSRLWWELTLCDILSSVQLIIVNMVIEIPHRK